MFLESDYGSLPKEESNFGGPITEYFASLSIPVKIHVVLDFALYEFRQFG